MFNNAIANGIIEKNPVIGIEFCREPNRSPNYISDEEVQRLIDVCDTEAIKILVILGQNTGVRLNELLSLKWDDVPGRSSRLLDRSPHRPGREDFLHPVLQFHLHGNQTGTTPFGA